MGNSYFKFKQFTVEQDACAMKVCTDACLFGAWVANTIKALHVKRMLDIGTGTGMMSLMVAQQYNVPIDAIEIDEAAALQASENFKTSPWAYRLNVLNADIRKLEPSKQYDFIFCNPPFFINDLKSSGTQWNTALHSTHLSAEDLIKSIKRLLTSEGHFALLLPPHRVNEYEQLANEAGLFIINKVSVQQTEKHTTFRVMLLFGTTHQTVEESKIIIKEGGSYSTKFIELLKDYYLYL